MRGRIDLGALPYATGAIALGLITILFRSFALQWQPVPAWLPTSLAWLSA